MSDCLVYDTSIRHRIYTTPFGVVKKAKRTSKAHDVLTQRRIHVIASEVLKNGSYSLLYTPDLSSDGTQYEMRKIDTRSPIWLGSDETRDPVLIEEVVRFWTAMYTYKPDGGFALLDFELYKQPSGRVAVIDFDSTGFVNTDLYGNATVTIPGKEDIPPAMFFVHPCFPPDFEERLSMRLPIGKRNISA